MENRAQNLRTVGLFEELDNAALDKISQSCTWRKYQAQEQIIDKASDSRDVFFVVSGRVRVVLYSISGREVTLDDLDAGAYFGEFAAIDGQPRSASVMAIKDSELASMTPRAFLDMLLVHPQLAIKVMQRLAYINRTSVERIMDLSTLGANNRVHAELLRLSQHTIGDDGSAFIKPIPIHSDIASRVSTTRETVARVLNSLSRAGLVVREPDRLVIKNVYELLEMVEEVRGE